MAEFLVQYGYKNFTVTVDDEDYERVRNHKWSIINDDGILYAHTHITKNPIRLHRFILNLSTGDGIVVDHKDHNGLNNSKSNLRRTTHGLNHANRRKQSNSTSVYKGVYWHKERNKWMARIQVNYKFKYLGSFTDEIEAARAYDKAALEAFGEFAHVNGV